MNATTFAQQVDEAIASCNRATAPWVPSRADIELALQPIVQQLLSMPSPQAWQFIRESFRGAGTADALVVQLFKDAQQVPKPDASGVIFTQGAILW